MIISEDLDTLRKAISDLKQANPDRTIGFVPTMGALHQGHLSLVNMASEHSDIVVVSVFVNPTQFNDPTDLDKYPRTLQADINLLEQSPCDILFVPSEKEVYPHGKSDYEIDLKGLDKVMEGKFRDDHFKGVCMVVERLFEIVRPDKAIFGLKDFQQVAIIKHMVQERNIDVEIISAPIIRSSKGLALSSRNSLLTEAEKDQAIHIFKTLEHAKALVHDYTSASKLQKRLLDFFNEGNLKLEYLEIVDNQTLQPTETIHSGITCCIAAYCGSVRLIDNMQLA